MNSICLAWFRCRAGSAGRGSPGPQQVMVEEIKQSELSAVVADKSKEKAEAESPDEANAGAPDALKKQTNASADSGDQTGVQDSSPAPDVGNDVSDTIDVDVFNDDDADSAGQDRGDLDDLEDTPSVGKGGSSDEVDDGEDDEEDDDEEDDDEEVSLAPKTWLVSRNH